MFEKKPDIDSLLLLLIVFSLISVSADIREVRDEFKKYNNRNTNTAAVCMKESK